MRPRASAARLFSSSSLPTTSTGALIPCSGVPIEPPSDTTWMVRCRVGTALVVALGAVRWWSGSAREANRATAQSGGLMSEAARNQCGTPLTGWRRGDSSRPSSCIRCTIQRAASRRLSVPPRRAGKWSVKKARRVHISVACCKASVANACALSSSGDTTGVELWLPKEPKEPEKAITSPTPAASPASTSKAPNHQTWRDATPHTPLGSSLITIGTTLCRALDSSSDGDVATGSELRS
mmetsp:Transcript_28352/g.71204  ORF Transcript_28352/g.71204 Transcript_28352/m.71204 type:complete len:238 (-) Transcript_28352:156-869(-)